AESQIQENGRFALGFIGAATRQAGYMSCGSSASVTNQLNSAPTLPYNFAQAVYGFEYTGTAPLATYAIASENPAPVPPGSWTGGLDANIPIAGAAYAIPGSDVLVVRFVPNANNPNYATSIGPPSFFGTPVTTSLPTALPGGSLVVISNCVTSVAVQANALTFPGFFEVGGFLAGVTPGVSGGPIIPTSLTDAQIGIVTTDVFYVGQGADGSPALFVLSNNTNGAGGFSAAQELVPGVENMQLLYGVDATGAVTTPTEYDTAAVVTAAGNWANVVSVRAALLLRSATGTVPIPTAAPPYNLLGTTITAPIDTRLRRVFTTTIAIRF
ncbi:MAG: PilW family protein, partial [Candidatus Dormibacteria bacterium]